MPGTLSDADVFNGATPAGTTLSDADVFGGEPAKPAAPPPRQPRSDTSIALGGVAAGAKAVARSVADFGDMFASIPGMVMGTAADVASRVQSFAEGADPRAAGRIARQVREGVTSTFSPTVLRDLTEKAIQAVAPDKKELQPSDVQNGMQIITEGLNKGGAWVEKATKGAITADTFDSLVNEGMALGGVKGAGGLARRVIPAEKAPAALPPTEVPDTPAAAAAARDVRADVEVATGVNQLPPKEAVLAQKARRDQARAAFKEDPEYADYLRNYADQEAQLREQAAPLSAPGGLPTTGPRAERTGLRDAVEPGEPPPANTPALETGAPDVLDSALAKIREGRAFDITPEERIRLRDSQSSFGKPAIQVEGSPQTKLPPREDVNAILKEHGQEVPDSMSAERAWNDGQRVFALHEGADIPHEVRTIEELRSYTPDQLMTVPKSVSKRGQRGSASTRDLAALAAFVGTAAAMQAWSDDPSVVKDVVTGLLASAATRVSPRGLLDSVRRIRDAKPLESIADVAIDRESNIRLSGIDTSNTVRRVVQLVPDEARREVVHEALDTGKTKGLSEKERAAYDILRGEYDRLGQLGLDADTLKSVRANYATHMWKMDSDLVERLFGKRGYGTSPNTPYALNRMFDTMAEGEKAGLVPVSKDAAFVFATYANSLASAVENGRMLEALKTKRTATGDLLVAKTSDAPPRYVTIQNPQLRGLAVHPEIASQMRFIFDNPSASGVGAALEIIADVTKRSAVSASLFHAKALTDVLVAAVPGKAKYFAGAAIGATAAYAASSVFDDDHALREAALGGILGFVGPRLKAYATGRNAFLDEVKKGSTSDFVTRAVKSGLVFGTEKGPLVVDDAGRRFYDAMALVQKEADRIASPVGIKAGKGVEMYIKANHWMDDMMWGRLHPAMKLEVWSKTSSILRESSIARNVADPKRRILSQAEADQIASKYTNDMFGGLNWTRIAMEATTPLGRAVAQELLSASGRRVMRIAMFAPDWTISTARAALAAIDKDLVNPLKWGNVAKGMFQPITRGDLARQYVARSALYYLVAGDAINYSMSGHHLWQNDDKVGWSFIDWGDGRRMQFSKHIMETPHWVDHPVRQAIGKLGYVPKEIANQALGTEYLAPSVGKRGDVFAGPKMKDPSVMGRVAHALTGLTPIPAQGGVSDASAWGFFGMPIYGKTLAQREQIVRERQNQQRDKR